MKRLSALAVVLVTLIIVVPRYGKFMSRTWVLPECPGGHLIEAQTEEALECRLREEFHGWEVRRLEPSQDIFGTWYRADVRPKS